MLEYELLSSYPNIFHFTTTRCGGYSEGSYASFNCSPFSGDKEENVGKNREKLMEYFPVSPRKLVIPQQTHGTRVADINREWIELPEQEWKERLTGTDALITSLEGICLCVTTADCVPLLLYDVRNSVVAAIHAGWRGSVKRIVRRVTGEMNRLYGSVGKEIVACIGPSISPTAFEVGNEVYETFRKEGFDMEKIACLNEVTGKYHIDLWRANSLELQESGIPENQIEVVGKCTYTHPDRFYSARRLGIASGRMLSGIMILKKQ